MKVRGRSCFLALVPVLLAAVHCDELPLESSLAPRNDCSEHACEAFKQDGVPTCDFVTQMCRVNSTLEFKVLLSTPAGAPPYSVPLTAVMSSTDLRAFVSPETCPRNAQCAYVPQLASSLGWYSFDPDARRRVGIDLGNPGAFTTIPHHTTWYPLVYDPLPPNPAPEVDTPLSTDFGFPASPVLAPVIVPISVSPGPPAPRGPFGSDPIGWKVSLPRGRYLRVVSPEPPFDQVFPPHEQVLDLQEPELHNMQLTGANVDPETARKFKISPDPAGPRDLTGFTAVLQNNIRHRNISRMATLHAGTSDVTLLTIGHPNLTDKPEVELVVAPPRGTDGVPSLVSPAIPIIPGSQQYPVVPPPAVVTGAVVGPEDQGPPPPVQATLDIRSIEQPGAITSNQNVLLRYATTVRTDPTGAFQVKLPLGRYDVAIFPNPTSPGTAPLALWVGTMTVDGGAAPRRFPLVRQTTVKGTAALADGTALAEAEVEAHAAANTATNGPFAHAMRSAQTVTDATGAFSLELDPGDYDIVVRPRVGTRFPWVVSTSHKIADVPVTLDRLVVPAPIVVSVTLLTRRREQQPVEAPVRGAVVRAFAVAKCPSGQSCGGRAVEIGQTITDADGKLELFLTEPRSVSARPPN